MADLRRRLDELNVARHTEASAVTAPAGGPPHRLADLVGGAERVLGRHACWHVETAFDRACRRHGLALPRLVRDWAAQLLPTPVAGLDPAETMVLDIETGGFSGTEVFLVGLVLLDRRPLSVVQWLARDYPEEETILRGVAELVQQRDVWVTFNGKAFDEPFLRDRAARYRVALPPLRNHVDLLVTARRQWRGQLPNFKLQTLEQQVLGWQRVGDVPGADIPDLFHHFIRTGNAAVVQPILEHNQLDLISCTELLHRLG